MSFVGIKFEKLFQNKVSFFGSYFDESQLPKFTNSKQVAIIGRSNVGKSSLINSIAMNKNLAFTSKKPGCTMSINFYLLGDPKDIYGEKHFLVDLPGYGYAKKDKNQIKQISQFVSQYILRNSDLKKIYLLIDSNVGFQESDREFVKFLNQNNIFYQIVLTKIDKSNKENLENLKELLQQFFRNYKNVDDDILFVSSKKYSHIEQLRSSIIKCFSEIKIFD